MKIEKNKRYQIKGESPYFKEKYGTSNPIIKIEDRDTAVWGGTSWMQMDGNPTAMMYGMRSGFEDLPNGDVWYGKVYNAENIGLAELVHESELEAV